MTSCCIDYLIIVLKLIVFCSVLEPPVLYVDNLDVWPSDATATVPVDAEIQNPVTKLCIHHFPAICLLDAEAQF